MNLFGAEQEETTSDDYYTPSWLFEDMAVEFDLDVASPPGGVPWIPAKRFLTMADDGLSTPWEGRVWCNPPYSKAGPWVDRLIVHGSGVLLVPLVDSQWLDRLWASADGGVLLPNDMTFDVPGRENIRQRKIMFRVSLWAFGDWAVEAISRIGHVR